MILQVKESIRVIHLNCPSMATISSAMLLTSKNPSALGEYLSPRMEILLLRKQSVLLTFLSKVITKILPAMPTHRQILVLTIQAACLSKFGVKYMHMYIVLYFCSWRGWLGIKKRKDGARERAWALIIDHQFSNSYWVTAISNKPLNLYFLNCKMIRVSWRLTFLEMHGAFSLVLGIESKFNLF